MYNVELVLDVKALLGEGPIWEEKSGLVYWVDILSRRIHSYSPTTKESRIIPAPEMVGAIVPRNSGGLIAAMQSGFYTVNLETEEFISIADPEPNIPTNRFNDGKCDPVGRFWAGTMDLTETSTTGSLYRLDLDMKYHKMVEHVTISNGLSWDVERQIMYYIDTPTRQVVAFDFDMEQGTIRNKRIVVQIPDGEGFPDGMTIDAEGMLWVAHWEGYQVSRWNPLTGEKIDVIKLPVARVTSCCFAGENLDELYITTARTGLGDTALAAQPTAGGLFRVKTNVKGTKTCGFAG